MSRLGFDLAQALEEKRFRLFISNSERQSSGERQLIEAFQILDLKGLVFVPSGIISDDLYSRIGNLPTLILDREEAKKRFDFVAVNSRGGTLHAVDHLAALGHTKVGYLKGTKGTSTAQQRLDSFKHAMKKSKLTIRDEFIFNGDYTLSSGRACAEHLLALPPNTRPTAILAGNDLMAIGLMQRLQSKGWILPRDLSVIGFDNIEWSNWVYPSLTTIEQPIDKIVTAAVNLLIERITQKKKGQPRRKLLASALVQRESVCKPPGDN